MKMKFLFIAFLSIMTLNLKAQEEIFEKVYNRTWFENSGFAGTFIVFYKTTNGLLKAIKQINGSGVPIISSEIYDVEIQEDTIYLLNGINLKTAEKVGNYYYNFDKKTGLIHKNEEHVKILSNEPILFTWTDKRKDVKTQIDVKRLSDILIKVNEIYKEENLVKILIDK